MSVIRTVPKSALFREVAGKFTFSFATTGVYAGKYLCAVNTADVLTMKPNTFYLVDTLCVSGSIPETVFVESLQPDNLLTLKLVRYQQNELLTARNLVLSQYYKDKSVSTHVPCNKGSDGIRMVVSGRLNQVVDTVGIADISFVCSLGIYEIDGVEYNRFFRDRDGE